MMMVETDEVRGVASTGSGLNNLLCFNPPNR